MKYYVIFSCGHEGEVNLYGKAAERDRRIAWYEKEGICPDCYRKMKEEERRKADEELTAYADKIETEYNLPELEGTEKQIAWARKIRAGVIRAWEAEHNTFYNEFVTIWRGKVEEESNAYRYKIKHGATPPPKKRKPLCLRWQKPTAQCNCTSAGLRQCQRHGSSITAICCEVQYHDEHNTPDYPAY